MGKACCGTPGVQTYQFNGKEQKIKIKDAKTIERFAAGGNARIQVKNKKIEMGKEIADLKKPTLPEMEKSKETLMAKKEWETYLATKNEGKDLVWNNYWTKIDDKREYKGEFNKDNKTVWEGLGYIKYQDGSLYSGNVKDKNMNGKGRMDYANGDVYQGDWVNGKAHGKGVFYDKQQGTLYDGEWVNDQQEGKGKETWDAGDSEYTGDFTKGKKTGKGKYTKDGNVYEGDFVDGKFKGKGKYYFVDSGKTYEGDFHNNQMNGKGKMTWPDQSSFDGNFKNGKAHGNGVEYMTNGDKFTGQFQNDLKHGTGIYYSAENQTRRQGEWQNGKRVAWLTQPQTTYVGAEEASPNTKFTGNSPSRLYRGGRWRNDFKENFKAKYNVKSNVGGVYSGVAY